MKKILVCLLTVLLLLTISGCKNDNNQEINNNTWIINDDIDDQDDDNAKEALEKAAKEITGADFDFICVLGTQIVNGTNYIMLVEEELVTEKKVEKLAIVSLYNSKEETKIKNVTQLDFDALITQTTIVENTDGQTGGWHNNENLMMGDIDKKILDKFNTAIENLVGAGYEVIDLLATKKGESTIYAFLTRETMVVAKPYSFYSIAFVEETKDGAITLNNVYGINLADYR